MQSLQPRAHNLQCALYGISDWRMKVHPHRNWVNTAETDTHIGCTPIQHTMCTVWVMDVFMGRWKHSCIAAELVCMTYTDTAHILHAGVELTHAGSIQLHYSIASHTHMLPWQQVCWRCRIVTANFAGAHNCSINFFGGCATFFTLTCLSAYYMLMHSNTPAR